MNKKKIATIAVVISTIVLAGIAVFTAIRLYQLRQESVSPAAPESEPAAAEPQITSCNTLAFTISTPTSTPSDSPTPTSTPTDTPTAAPTDTPTTPPTTPPTVPPGGTVTPEPALPQAGISFPTMLSGGLGILIILGSLVLIF